MVKHFYHYRVFKRICESRRNQNQTSFLLTNITLNVINKTKEVFKAKKPGLRATLGLSKYPKVYDNGGLIVATKGISDYFEYTFLKCEVNQCNKLQTDHLKKMG